MSNSHRTIQDEARTLVGDHNSAVPVDVVKLARCQGVEVIEHELPSEHSAMLLRKNDKAIIVVNKKHHPRRQRFSIAHELGHLKLHPSAGQQVGGAGEVFHRHEYHRKSSPQEREANRFAAEVLMPEQAVRKAAEDLSPNMVTDLAIQKLARMFDVSVAAMTIRLQTLGLLEFEGHW